MHSISPLTTHSPHTACHKSQAMVAHRIMIFTIGDLSALCWLPAGACTRARAAKTRPWTVWSCGCPRSGRARPSRPRHPRSFLGWVTGGVGLARACDERERWIVNPASLWTAMRPAGSPYVGCLLASVARRLGAACVCQCATSSFFRQQKARPHPASIELLNVKPEA
jgi:hypothetical protein